MHVEPAGVGGGLQNHLAEFDSLYVLQFKKIESSGGVAGIGHTHIM